MRTSSNSRFMAGVLAVLMIIPMIQAQHGKPWFSRRYFLLLIPTAGFAAIFAYTLHQNFMIGHGTYAPSAHAALVWLNSLHRLFWP